MDVFTTLKITTILVSIGMLISSVEILFSISLYTSNGLTNWKFSKSRSAHLTRNKEYSVFFQDKNFNYLISLRMIAVFSLLYGISSINFTLIFIGYFFSTISYIALSLRSPFGLDGSDQATLLVSLLMFVYAIFSSEFIRVSVYWFLALQLTLVYLTSGWCKIKSKGWRDGTYLWKIFSTDSYGTKRLGVFLRKHKTLSKIMGLSVVLLEMCFFLFWILPIKYAIIILILTGMFHLMTAFFMGLNTFLWAFLAMYPSAIYCKLSI